MCFYNSISVRGIALAERYDRQLALFDDERYVVPAHSRDVYPVVTAQKEIQLLQWGLIPNWKLSRVNTAQEDMDKISREAFAIQRSNYNAKVETVFDKSTFKESIYKRRCIIPSTGYIEYHHFTSRLKQPYFISLKDEEVFSIAGVYDFWTHPVTGIFYPTFSMLTVMADDNNLIKWIHNGGRAAGRMPVIIKKEDEERWLNPNLIKEEIQTFFKSYPESEMYAYPIKNEFKEPDNAHNPEIIMPIEQEIC